MPLTGMALITVFSFMACTALFVLTDYSTIDSTINFVCFPLSVGDPRQRCQFYFQFVLGLVSLVYHFDDVASVFFLTHFLSFGSF